MNYQLAQVNIARLIAPLDDPLLSEFVHFLEPINGLAENSPGFVWRLKDEEGTSATTIETPFDDDMMVVNMSVWENVEALRNFAYKTAYSYFVKSGSRWFEKLGKPHLVLWWVPAGEYLTLQDAAEKLALLAENGSSASAFNFGHLYDANGQRI
ncbi:MAG: DUF3291 domain-containing protein [Bacteroidota bacterium]